ncbi:hypothetical protein [Ulvibacterium sp.]|uniref:hypothetical protein n=1 Tax=Ulvibacterium sp. TaxID=2665914 RepID=UPI003BAB24C4
MIMTYLDMTINRKEDIEIVQDLIRQVHIDAPVFIIEFEDRYEVSFADDYEQWELESAIEQAFPEYEFTEDLGKGRKEIRIEFARQQSSFSTDDWGRPLENPINEKKYLIKKSKEKIVKFSPQVKALFGDSDSYYFINIVSGIDKKSNKTGYLVLDDFKEFDKDKDGGFLRNELYETPMKAFWSGVREIKHIAESDYAEFVKNTKRKGKRR